MFSKKTLSRLIIPLLIEQVLAITVGLADTVMVSRAGEAAVSGVSLIDVINVLLIGVFSSLATGGAVVSAQFLGQRNQEKACRAAEQLLLSATLIALIIMAGCTLGGRPLLQLIYGKVDIDIMKNARIYFFISALSFPFMAIYNACAALYRSMGNSKVSMMVSAIMNLINVIGNAICIFGLHMGAAGVAIPTLIARIIGAVIMLWLIRNPKQQICIRNLLRLRFDFTMTKRILRIGVPNGLEGGIFQLGKILVSGLVAGLGIVATTANAVAISITNFGTIPGAAIGLALITVVGQCIGAGDEVQARGYTKKLLGLSYLLMLALNIGIAIASPVIVGIYGLSAESAREAVLIIISHCIASSIFWVPSFVLPNALRAANDVKYTMYVSIFSMWTFRIGVSFLLVNYFHLGVIGVWFAMYIDWFFRDCCFLIRFIRRKLRAVYS